MTTTPYWLQALALVLNVVQTIALAYVAQRWRRSNGALKALQASADRAAAAAATIAGHPEAPPASSRGSSSP